MTRFQRRALRLLAASLAAAAPNLGFAAAGSAATPSQAAATCTNPASGTTWKITIDYAHSTVDANAASISDTQISWHDAKDGGNYTLDRKSGKLTFVAASSTGGYFVSDHCSLDDPG
ncbi:MAG TPA: hypothetical protein VGL83_11820 [Stellaceae bacterium]|jgi:hypothetical protein